MYANTKQKNDLQNAFLHIRKFAVIKRFQLINDHLGILHGPVVGLSTDIGYKFEDGFDSSRFAGCDLVLCGDIHKRQVFPIPNEKKAYMVGSTIQQNFGETVRKHGYGIYEIEEDKYEFVDLENPKPFLSFKITSIDDLVNGTEKLLNY